MNTRCFIGKDLIQSDHSLCRPGCCCDHRIMLKHAGNALEDMVVAIADSVAAMYLGQSSLMGGQEENDWPILVRSSILSTRVLERFRNQVCLP
jgi:hypothetical protein